MAASVVVPMLCGMKNVIQVHLADNAKGIQHFVFDRLDQDKLAVA